MDALGINLGYIIMQILLFTILMLVLRGYLYEPVINSLEERKAKIAKGLEDARQAAIARDSADADAKKILDEARADAARQRQEAAAAAEEQSKSIIASANDEAKQVVANASNEAEEERNRILADARGQIAAIAIAAANKLVGEALDEKKQRALVEEFFTNVPADVAKLSGDRAEVTSALPLTDAEQRKIQSTLNVNSVDYKVNPEILGGLIIRVGDKVVDNSVAARTNALRDSLG